MGDGEKPVRHVVTSYVKSADSIWERKNEIDYELSAGWEPIITAISHDGKILAVTKQVFPSLVGKAQIDFYDISGDSWAPKGASIITDLQGKDLEGMLVTGITLSGDGRKVAFAVGAFSDPSSIDTSSYVGFHVYNSDNDRWELQANFAYPVDDPKDFATRPVINTQGTRLAVSDANGKYYIYDLEESTDTTEDVDSGQPEVYPNPHSDKFHVSGEHDGLVAYDISGRQIEIRGDGKSGYELMTSEAGCYFLKVSS